MNDKLEVDKDIENKEGDEIEFEEEQLIEEKVEEEEPTAKKEEDEEKDYLLKALEMGDEQTVAWVKYNAIGLKLKEGKEISQEEKQFMADMNKLYEMEKQKEDAAQKAREESEQVKKNVLEEYKKTKELNPSKIDVVLADHKASLRGSDSLPKILKFAFLMKKAKKKGGKILVKVTRDRRVMLEWTLKEVNFVEFWTTDEKGNSIPEVTRFSEFKYNYEGSPIPVLFAIQGHAEGYDFFSTFRKDITSEMVSRIASRARHAGFLEGVRLQDKNQKKDKLAEFMPLMILAILLIMGVVAYLCYSIYQDNTQILNALEAIKSAANTAPLVVQ